MKRNYKESISFLKSWNSSGFWVLTSISICKTKITTDSFATSEEDKVLKWLKDNKDRNIYFSVNPTLRPISNKASREDILNLSWLHVDIDPRAGEDIEEERKRALDLLKNPPDGIPKPTCIIFSGGGYQGFWKIKNPVPINGEEENYENAKRYNLQLEIIFGADNCHNVDRIMRLPGTVNWPDERKKKKGRIPSLAKLTYFNNKRSYNISDFTPAVITQSPSGATFSDEIEISGNIQRLNSVDDLPDSISENCKVVIVQGYDPDDPQRWPSRSEPLFWVCCELVRANCDDDLIYSVITDPDFKISDSVTDKGSGMDKYAKKQIKSARDNAIDPNLRILNEKHAVIGSINGKCRIISEEQDAGGLKRSRLTYQTFNDFLNRYCHKKVHIQVDEEKTISIPLGKWWINHKDRRDYERLIFSPGRDIPNCYNLWKGFAFDAKPTGSCELFLEHIKKHVCGNSDLIYDYLIGWMAQGVQEPDQPGHTAVVLRGKRGTGKGFFAKNYGALFGRHFLQITNPKHLVGSFNAHLRDCVVLFADEAFYAGDKKHESLLKSLITEELIVVEAKSVDAELSRNYTHIIMASNEEWVIPAGANERRFLMLDVSDDVIQNTKYFKAIQDQLDNGGYEALLHHLLHHDISKFDVRSFPKTDALRDQRILSFSKELEWWFDILSNGEIAEGQGWPEYVFCTELTYNFMQYVKNWNIYNKKGSEIAFGRFIRKMFPEDYRSGMKKQLGNCHKVICVDGKERSVPKPRIYVLPPLKECRDHFNHLQGDCFKWKEIKLIENIEKQFPF